MRQLTALLVAHFKDAAKMDGLALRASVSNDAATFLHSALIPHATAQQFIPFFVHCLLRLRRSADFVLADQPGYRCVQLDGVLELKFLDLLLEQHSERLPVALRWRRPDARHDRNWRAVQWRRR